MCGGILISLPLAVHVGGLSPRVRGHPSVDSSSSSSEGSIPACAGASASLLYREGVAGVYPRVCGGISKRPLAADAEGGLSPRVRGHLGIIPSNLERARSIPACAGASRGFALRKPACQVYPRVCGGICRRADKPLRLRGLSPRVRGHLHYNAGNTAKTRSIPACAGASLLQCVRNRALRALRSVYRSERATFCRRDNHCFSTCRFERPNATAPATRSASRSSRAGSV